MPDFHERKLSPQWSPELVALSYLISWLGAYTSTQIMIHAKYTRSTVLKWTWTFFASIAFGFCAIWSMHFVGMLACRLDVQVRFNIPLTIVSAAVAVVFTFAALASPYASEAVENSNSAPIRAVTEWVHDLGATAAALFASQRAIDLEAGYAPLQTADPEEHTTVSGPDDAPLNGEDENDGSSDEEGDATPHTDRRHTPGDQHVVSDPGSGPSRASEQTRRPFISFLNDTPSKSKLTARMVRHRQRSLSSPRSREAGRDTTSSSSTTTTATSSSDESSSFTRNLSGTTLANSSSSSWGEPLRAGLSREARLRIKARAKERPLPEFGWRYWAKMHYKSINVLVFIRALIWALAICFMHYCGMWAMELPMGRIAWDMRIVGLSFVVAFSLCFVGCIFMIHMESHFGRQMIFSTVAAIGCCSMHYTGQAAATFYTYAPPSPNAGYPAFLPVIIVGIAVFVCVISNAMLAHSAITARDRMAEMILTKRRLWRIMAEKEAAEQAIKLKQQFISVASHEIRTPLHTVNGYCELLVRTDLTEEQSLYVTSIQQACHAINVIAGNVLDFSKLDRGNVELSARPVHMETRKMIVDIAKITEARGIQPGSPSVDIIVWIAKDVPQAVYLDETYAFRILMNLLSNAQKFCERGYICLLVSMSAPMQLRIEVADTGCGIPKSFRSVLFEPFRQADPSLTRPRQQGTGLGLSIVKHLVQRMSGTVEVESVEGEGSTFTVQFPVTLPSRSPSPTGRYVPPQGSTRRIRAVYRHLGTQEKFISLWKQYGYTALPGSHLSSADELAKDVDTIWTDSDTLAQSPALRSLVGSLASTGVVVFVVHSDHQDLSPLEPQLSSEGKNVILVKRPVIMHTVMEWMEAPEERMGTHIKPAKVRFALPEDEEQPSASVKEKEPLRMEVNGKEGGEYIGLSPLTSPISVSIAVVPVHRPKVLLVEDNLVNQRLGCRLLDKLGYEVTTANDGKQAIDAVRETYFACCLMDCQMPVLDGFQATKQIRELEQNGTLPDRLPIIALTANVTQESEDECRAVGMDHFMPKPLKMSDLDECLRQLRRPSEPPHR